MYAGGGKVFYSSGSTNGAGNVAEKNQITGVLTISRLPGWPVTSQQIADRSSLPGCYRITLKLLTQAPRGWNQMANRQTENFLSLPEGGLDLVTNRQGAIYSASTESPGPDWKPGSGFI